MNIFIDICQEIDIYNHEYGKDNLNIKEKCRKYVTKRKLLNLINNFGDAKYDTNIIGTFIETYFATQGIIDINDFKVEKSDIHSTTIASYKKDNATLKVILKYSDYNIITISFVDKESKDFKYTSSYIISNYLDTRRIGDLKKKKIVDYMDSVYRYLMVDYLSRRLKG